MTTIVAVKKGKRLCIAADTLTLFGSRKEIAEKHTCDKGKFIQIGSNFVGIAGHASLRLIFNHYFSETKHMSELRTADQIFETFNHFYHHLKKIYFLKPSYLDYKPFKSANIGVLIINPYGIFEADYLRVVREHKYFSAIGSGEGYALGAIKAVYDLIDDPEKIAKIGIEAAAQFDRQTDLPIQIQCINLE